MMRPTKAVLARLAERQPELLNPLVAYFCFGWTQITLQQPMHGKDQVNHVRLIPNYVGMFGVDECFHMLFTCPSSGCALDAEPWNR